MEKVTKLNIRSTKGAEITVIVTRCQGVSTRISGEDGIEYKEKYDYHTISLVYNGKEMTGASITIYKGMYLLIIDHVIAVGISKEDYNNIEHLSNEHLTKDKEDNIDYKKEAENYKKAKVYDKEFNEGGEGFNPYR